MRVPDKPLPGDLVIRCREEQHPLFKRMTNVWVVTHWPDTETATAGPYQSYEYAFHQARRLIHDRSEFVWRDHAKAGQAEQLELVLAGKSS